MTLLMLLMLAPSLRYFVVPNTSVTSQQSF